MMTPEELAAWRVAAITDELPAASRRDRWQPVRAGLVNLWEYDAAEVWYADGRMQLQGANESGKSTLMVLTTLLLLAGDYSPHNIDTLGQSDKRFRYYVEPSGWDLDRRDSSAQKNRGWAWLELGRGDEFFTIALFAEARRTDGMLKAQWCSAHGQTRVRLGLSLKRAGLVVEPGHLADVPGFTCYQSATAYRQAIGRVLYGKDDAWLGQLIRILRVVRTPQLGHKLDLDFLTSAFRRALPPISDDEVNQLADGWEQLQRLREDRDEASQALATVTDFSHRHWRPWADAVIRAAADPVTAAASELTQITREKNIAEAAAKTLAGQLTAVEGDRRSTEEARDRTRAERDALKEQQSYQDAVAAIQNAQNLAEQARTAKTAADRSRDRARSLETAAHPAAAAVEEAQADLASAEDDVGAAASVLDARAEQAGLTPVTTDYLPARDTTRLRQAVALRRPQAHQALRLIDAYDRAMIALETAGEKACSARADAKAARQAARDRAADVESAVSGVAGDVSRWALGIPADVRPAAELTEGWVGLVAGLTTAESPAPTLSAAIGREYLSPARRPLDDRRAALEASLKSIDHDLKEAGATLAAIEAERDPRPASPQFWVRRDRPEGAGPDGAPFWRLVETLEDAVPERLAQVEAALDAAGLLQAWVTPDGVHVPGRDGSDTVWRADGTSPFSSSLHTLLRPSDDCGSLAPVISALLGSVGYDDGTLRDGVGLSPSATVVMADGRWCHGGLSGLASPVPDGPRLLGAAARALDRLRRADALRADIGELSGRKDALATEQQEVGALLTALDEASATAPHDASVISAVLAARAAAALEQQQAEASEAATRAESAARDVVDTAAGHLSDHCAEHDLPATRTAVEEVLTALADYGAQLTGLDGAVILASARHKALAGAQDALDLAKENAATAAEDAESDRLTAAQLHAQAQAAERSLGKDAQQILDEVATLGKAAADSDTRLKVLADQERNLIKKAADAKATLAQVESKRADAEAERNRATARWWGCLDSGLPPLRAVAEPTARTVTTALETARAARAAISPRDWPDDPHRATQRVQRRWQEMTERTSELRPELERLGGRTIRVIPPGESHPDSPGAVEVIVDTTGTASPPPKAVDRLSDMLLRLEDDYNRELTETIDELLGSTFIEHLRDRLAEAETLREEINAKLAQNPTAVSGITLRLRRAPVADEETANDVLDALERDFALLAKPVQDRIRQFLARRVTSAQEQARIASDPDWRSRLAQTLDYRRWFDLRVEYRTPQSGSRDAAEQGSPASGVAGGWRKLDRGNHGLLSGGAKVVTLMQPLIAALHAMYDQADGGPRMLWLDEAFGGVDSTNKASMFRLLASCDLDWLIAGPGIIANSGEVPAAAIYEVRRAPQPDPGVALELAVWAGNELTAVSTPDPADLRDLTPYPRGQNESAAVA
jgi:hypothetical protein